MLHIIYSNVFSIPIYFYFVCSSDLKLRNFMFMFLFFQCRRLDRYMKTLEQSNMMYLTVNYYNYLTKPFYSSHSTIFKNGE